MKGLSFFNRYSGSIPMPFQELLHILRCSSIDHLNFDQGTIEVVLKRLLRHAPQLGFTDPSQSVIRKRTLRSTTGIPGSEPMGQIIKKGLSRAGLAAR